MGKVFSYEELLNDRVPVKSAHRLAAREMLRLEFDAVGSEVEPVGVMVHGSTARREANIRSDVDVLTILPSGSTPDQVEDYVLALEDVAHEFSVTVEPIVLTEDDAQNGLHTIDVLFLEYLVDAEATYAMVSKGDGIASVSGLIAPCESDRIAALEKYLVSKRDKFLKRGNSADHVDTVLIQRALELPKAAQRRFLQAYGIDILAEDTKIAEQLAELSKSDKEYTTFLRRTMLSSDFADYNEVLASTSLATLSMARLASIGLVSHAKKLRESV